MKEHEITVLTIRQLLPVVGHYAVYAEEDEVHKGFHHLVPVHCEFLAVCDEALEIYKNARRISRTPGGATVSPVLLTDGWYEPCEHDASYAGICTTGDDIRFADGYLVTRDYPLLAAYDRDVGIPLYVQDIGVLTRNMAHGGSASVTREELREISLKLKVKP